MIVEATNCNRTYAEKQKSLADDFESAVIDFKDMPMGSIQFIWSGITGALDSVLKIYCSNTPELVGFDPDGTQIDGAEFSPHNTDGARIWIRDKVAFRYALVRYFKNGTTGGALDIIAIGKKS